jgi:hypothetical protein
MLNVAHLKIFTNIQSLYLVDIKGIVKDFVNWQMPLPKYNVRLPTRQGAPSGKGFVIVFRNTLAIMLPFVGLRFKANRN